jgi:L-histidine N-alpha-methyltransferase
VGETTVPSFRIDHHLVADRRAAMIDDVRRGLSAERKTLPAKYLYDERGAQLFDQICDQPEYYPTRTEEALLLDFAPEIVERCAPVQLVELGSGASRKTRLLLDAVTASCEHPCYVPVDVSEEMLRVTADSLRQDYPELSIHGIVGDYEHHLRHLPDADERLVIFLGSTIGNFSEIEGRHFLRALRAQLREGDHFLIGFDLVKAVAVLDAAYNDAAGVTAEFNRNVLRILNRELDADFDVESFRHEAFFNGTDSQIEMHLRTAQRQRVTIPAADLIVELAAGESIRTEISRKFTRATATTLLAAGGFASEAWFEPANGYFGLALASASRLV